MKYLKDELIKTNKKPHLKGPANDFMFVKSEIKEMFQRSGLCSHKHKRTSVHY